MTDDEKVIRIAIDLECSRLDSLRVQLRESELKIHAFRSELICKTHRLKPGMPIRTRKHSWIVQSIRPSRYFSDRDRPHECEIWARAVLKSGKLHVNETRVWEDQIIKEGEK